MVATSHRVVVADAGPIIHLDELGSLELLASLAPVLVPEEVWTEVSRHRPELIASSCAHIEVVAPSGPIPVELRTLAASLSLGAGEVAAIRLAQQRRADLILCDDAAARLVAEGMSYRVTGTLGILLRAFRLQQRSREEVLELLRMIPTRSTLHITRDLLAEAIAAVERAG